MGRIKVIFIHKLTKQEIVILNHFFEYAITIAQQQLEIKNNISETFRDFYLKYYCEEIPSKLPNIRVAFIYTKSILQQYDNYKVISEVLPMEKLKKLIGKKVINS